MIGAPGNIVNSFLDLVCQGQQGLGNVGGTGVFESWVISEVYKSWWNQGKQPRLYYYRDAVQKEIDLLVDRNSKLYPFEIKLNINSSHIFNNFKVLESMPTPMEFGGAIYSGAELVALENNHWLIPVSLI